MHGETLANYKIDDVRDGGRTFRKMLVRMRDGDSPEWTGPRVAMAWYTDSDIPHFSDSRGYPMLLIDLPASMEPDVPNLAGSLLKLTLLKHLTWASARAGLVLEGKHSAIELIASDLLPLLRLCNQGCILVVFVCANELTVVEYGFYREQFLGICFQLYLEGDDELEDGTALPGISRQCHRVLHGRNHWQPAISCVEDDERIYL